jgi:phage shock protein C
LQEQKNGKEGSSMSGQLARSKSDRMIAGVCGGLANYFNIDPVIVRLVFVVAVLFGGISPLVYVILWIVMPEESAIPAQPTLPQHPRPVEEWKYDPYTGEPIRREP